tara:strand:+ start:39166 stop:39825 length:660 start_codon:yes stop_codon:yes gene_type:complete
MSKHLTQDDNLSPEDYFPITDVIVGEHEQKVQDQERTLITKRKPMNKIMATYAADAPESNFWYRANGAGQLSFYRGGDFLSHTVHALVSCRILKPADNENAEPELSFRFSIQVNDDRYYFARLAAILDEDGNPACHVCAIKGSNLDEYHFQDKHNYTYTANELSHPITKDDMTQVTRLTQHDLIAAINLAKNLQEKLDLDRETVIMLKNLAKSVENTNF